MDRIFKYNGFSIPVTINQTNLVAGILPQDKLGYRKQGCDSATCPPQNNMLAGINAIGVKNKIS